MSIFPASFGGRCVPVLRGAAVLAWLLLWPWFMREKNELLSVYAAAFLFFAMFCLGISPLFFSRKQNLNPTDTVHYSFPYTSCDNSLRVP